VTVAFLFPGQGGDVARVGAEWLARGGIVGRRLEAAAELLGLPAAHLFAAAGRALERTEVEQPVVTALSVGIHEELAALGVRPDVVAGHSLGELAACAAAGAFDAEEAIAIAARRGTLMAEAAARHPGGMLALHTADAAVVEGALAAARARGLAALAAHNAPTEWVLSGDHAALQAVRAECETTPVPVAGPWHTDAMADVAGALRDAVRAVLRGPLTTTLLCNRTGEPVHDLTELPDLLAGQCTRPVQWTATMDAVARAGITDVVIVGAGRVLRALARRNLGRRVTVHDAEYPGDLAPLREALAR